jgi:hypothetical protein
MPGKLIRFGRFSILYEEGFIRYVRLGSFEIVRMIYFALRDSNWVTAGVVRSNENVKVTENGFDISYTATNSVASKNVFQWNVQISGNKSGEIEFSVDGHALDVYTRNRAGICVLHPIRETIDKVVEVTRPDGSVYESKFPATINPHQPFLDITSMKWQLEGGAKAELSFEGDIFETEDQRNWSDTSFKTYSTPLTIPYPVTLKPGDRVSQKVRLRISDADALSSTFSREIVVTVDESKKSPFPKIGALFPGRDFSSHKDVGLLTDLGLDHIHIEVNFHTDDWREHLAEGLAEAGLISASPFVQLVFGNDPSKEWDQFVKQLQPAEIKRITKLAFSPRERKGDVGEILMQVLSKARSAFPHAAIGAGVRSYFTELNRNRFDYSGIDFVIYPVNPQAHAKDSLTVIENLPAQTDAVRSAGTFATGKKVHVGPVSLRARFNSDATSESNEDRGLLPLRYDIRLTTALAAGWAMGSIKYLAEAGAEAITLFESHGMAGYFLSDDDWKHKDFDTELKLFPVYDALVSLRKLKPATIIKSDSSQPIVCSSLVLDGDNGRYLMLVNHTDVGISVRVTDKVYPVNGWEISITSLTK